MIFSLRFISLNSVLSLCITSKYGYSISIVNIIRSFRSICSFIYLYEAHSFYLFICDFWILNAEKNFASNTSLVLFFSLHFSSCRLHSMRRDNFSLWMLLLYGGCAFCFHDKSKKKFFPFIHSFIHRSAINKLKLVLDGTNCFLQYCFKHIDSSQSTAYFIDRLKKNTVMISSLSLSSSFTQKIALNHVWNQNFIIFFQINHLRIVLDLIKHKKSDHWAIPTQINLMLFLFTDFAHFASFV